MESKNYIFSSTQTGAPQLTVAAGSLIGVLDACLINGYNEVSVTSLIVSNNIATVVTSTPHNYEQYDTVVISGCNETQFNKNWIIDTIDSSTQFTFSITNADVTATGVIKAKTGPIGTWTKNWPGTNVAAYKNESNRYLQVTDTANNYGTMIMYETMTAINSGTNPTTPFYWIKNNNVVSSPIWILIGNKKMFYLFVSVGTTGFMSCYYYAFGDFISLKPTTDNYNTMSIGYSVSNPSYGNSNSGAMYINDDAASYYESQYIIRSYTETGNFITFFKISHDYNIYLGSTYNKIINFLPFDPMTNTTQFNYVFIVETATYAKRGKMPGMIVPFHGLDGVYTTGDKSIVLNNKRYIAISLSVYSSSDKGTLLIDISGNEWT